MRRWLFVWLTALFLAVAAAPAPAPAQTVTAAAQAKVSAILAQFPDGGTALSDAIAAALEADPSLAQAVAAGAQNATPAQQRAIGAGMAAAARFFANAATGTGPAAAAAQAAEEQILAALSSAPTLAQAAFTTFSIAFGGPSSNGVGTNRCVSPSNGHGRCDQH